MADPISGSCNSVLCLQAGGVACGLPIIRSRRFVMTILRRGSQRDHGPKLVISGLSLKEAYDCRGSVTWDRKNNQIIIFVPWVPYGDDRTHHDYYIVLTLEDISNL